MLALAASMLFTSASTPARLLAAESGSLFDETYAFGSGNEFVLDPSVLDSNELNGLGRRGGSVGSVMLHADGSPVTVAQIEELMSGRTFALMEGNYLLADEITATLRTMGVAEISLEEVRALTGDVNNGIEAFSVWHQHVHLESVISSIFIWCPQLGRWDDRGIMRIYARPISRQAAMWHEGTVTNVTRTNFFAGTANLVTTWAEFAIGESRIGTAFSMFTALRDSVQGFTSNSHISLMTVDYIFHATESTVFFHRHNGSNWVLFARTSEVNYQIIAHKVGHIVVNNATVPTVRQIPPIIGTVGHPQRRDASILWNNVGDIGPFARIDTSMEVAVFRLDCLLQNNNPRMRVQMIRPAGPADAR